MQQPKYISPSALGVFEYDQSEYYLKYCADKRPPSKPQTQPMSIGSAFDAYVKAYISENFFGEIREGYGFEEMFETQVEAEHRDWARENGLWAFNSYIKSGALADIMLQLQLAVEEPLMEFKVEGHIIHEADVNGVILHGRPDLYFKTEHAHTIVDWKVNGYCGATGVSPKTGYVKCSDGWSESYAKRSKTHGVMHKECQPMIVDGIRINIGKFFETVDSKWADQLTTYGWVLGEPVGAPLVICIEQLACKPNKPGKPLIRVATHAGYVSESYQISLYKRYVRLWQAIQSGHIIADLPEDEAKERQQLLDDQHLAYKDDTENNRWFTRMTRKH